jgi:hypothetical protein
MKKLAAILAIILLSCNSNEENEESIKIIETTQIMMPDFEKSNQKEGDILVFKVSGEQSGEGGEMLYSTIMFRNVDGRLRDYRSFVKAEYDYEEAKYYWENDSTVTFRFVNTDGRTTESYTMSGYGNITTLKTK